MSKWRDTPKRSSMHSSHKLPEHARFLDLSDYGRYPARILARSLAATWVRPIHITGLYTWVGMAAIGLLWQGYWGWAAVLLLLKSVLDAADGELARVKQQPSVVGRYADSISDMLLNIGFLTAIGILTSASVWGIVAAIFSMQLQGTLYNYYYLIRRHQMRGDATSRIREYSPPVPEPGDDPLWVGRLHRVYLILYGWQDAIIHRLDPTADRQPISNGILTLVSVYGLGFQLLLIAGMLAVGWVEWVVPVMAWAGIGIPVVMVFRRYFSISVISK